MILLYNFFIFILNIAFTIAALWNKKAAHWVNGRKNLFKKLEANLIERSSIIWIHASSAGEFEQAKPVIDEIKDLYPQYKIVVSFFSPSGYAVGKKYVKADVVTYLPLDTKANAEKFLKLVNPSLVVFIKYDYWYHHLKSIYQREIPLLLISAIFRERQAFFKWYGSLHKKMLSYFTQLFVQDEESLTLLNKISITNTFIAGDTRFDRVMAIASVFNEIELIKEFAGNNKLIVAGSTWKEDEVLLSQFYNESANIKFIVAPHEINNEHLQQVKKMFNDSVLYSQFSPNLYDARVLIIDNIGMLSRLYHYATITYVGGGFNKSGIHNTLEAAVFGKPIIFGPNYQKFKEAVDLINAGGAFSVQNYVELNKVFNDLLNEKNNYNKSAKAAGDYVENNTGATKKIMSYIQENRLLTI